MYKLECPYCSNIDFSDQLEKSIEIDTVLICSQCKKKISFSLLWQ